MSGFFEALFSGGGAILGGVGGGVAGAAAGAAVQGSAGALIGGTGGAVFAGVGALPGAAAGATIGGGYGATVGGIAGATAGAAGGYAIGGAAGANIDKHISDWWNADQAADKADAKAKAITCATCPQNPCAKFACGVPGSKYRGGAHGCVGVAENKIGEKGTIHSHHMPADAYSPLARPVGPSIQMLDVDHRLTSSYGSKVHGPPYAPQRTALASGQTMQAIRMDIRNARNIAAAQGDPTRYDDAIDQMMRYALCLKENGIIQ